MARNQRSELSRVNPSLLPIWAGWNIDRLPAVLENDATKLVRCVEQAEITQTMIMETQLIQIPMVPSMEDLPYKTLFINCDSNEVGNIMRRIYDAALRHHIFPIDGLLDEPGQIGNSIRKGSV